MKYRILYSLYYLISLLPLKVLYVLSDIIAFVIHRLLRYRKAIIMQNLLIAFPEKTDEERNAIANKFYQNIVDSLIETIKLISANDQQFEKMFVFDESLFEDLQRTDKKIQMHGLHGFNWEVLNLGISKNLQLPFLGVYQPIKNPFFEKLLNKIRTKYGTILIPATDFKNHFYPFKDQQYVIALVADQNPKRADQSWWVDFFGRPTAFTQGPENAARATNNRVVFGNFYKIKRGVYTCSVESIIDDPASLQPGELTLKYVLFAEKCIRARPDNYLWSHRRWKHEYKEEYAALRLTSANL